MSDDRFIIGEHQIPATDPMLRDAVRRIRVMLDYHIDKLDACESAAMLFFRLNAIHLAAERYRDTLKVVCSLLRDVPTLEEE